MKSGRTIIGIAGASGAGKSRFAGLLYSRLVEKYPGTDVAIVHEDSYYRSQPELSPEQRAAVNYDHPDSLEHELLMDHLGKLRGGQPVDVPLYDYSVHDRLPETRLVQPARVVLLEGILVLNDPAIRAMLDLAIFVDVPLDICLMRRLRRDIGERGRSLESVLRQYEATVRPGFFRFVEPMRHYADLIIPRGGENEAALEVLFRYLDRMMGG